MILQCDIVEHGIGKHAFELAILIFQSTQAFGFVRRANDSLDHLLSRLTIHPAKLGLPFVNAGIADAMLAAQVGDGNPVRHGA